MKSSKEIIHQLLLKIILIKQFYQKLCRYFLCHYYYLNNVQSYIFLFKVKNFGRSGRTKYTHLVDQDTTSFESPWVSETAQNLKFHTNQAAGMKQVFQKPTLKKQRTK